jgi:hypothetical protein
VLFDRYREKSDPRKCAQEIRQSLHSPETDLFQRFERGLGIDVHPSVFHVLSFILGEVEVPRELITPDFLGNSTLSLGDCETILEYLKRIGCVNFYKDKDTFQVESTIEPVLLHYESSSQ